MPQPYPSSVKPVEPARPPAPPSVQNAVKLMYAGAGAATVSLVVFLVSIGAIRNANKTAHTPLSSAQLNSFFITTAVYLLISVGLWLWMARANSQGKSWARITATVLFVLNTVDLYGILHYPKTLTSLLIPVVTWLIGLGAVILLWRRESTEFFKPPGRV